MRVKTDARFIFMVAFVIAGFTLAVQPTLASETGKKLSEEVTVERAKKATDKYISGVRHMKKALLITQIGDSAFAYNYRATSDAKAGKEIEKAINDFKKAIALNPEFAEAYNNLGYCYRKTGKLKQSLEAFDMALSIDSNFAQVRKNRGETFLALGNLVGAQRELTYLKTMKSSYADTLALVITRYKLAKINRKTSEDVSKKH